MFLGMFPILPRHFHNLTQQKLRNTLIVESIVLHNDIFSFRHLRFMSQLGDLGSGAGKGGGGGGSIREAGGAFGKAEAAKEEEYFYKKVVFYSQSCPPR